MASLPGAFDSSDMVLLLLLFLLLLLLLLLVVVVMPSSSCVAVPAREVVVGDARWLMIALVLIDC